MTELRPSYCPAAERWTVVVGGRLFGASTVAKLSALLSSRGVEHVIADYYPLGGPRFEFRWSEYVSPEQADARAPRPEALPGASHRVGPGDAVSVVTIAEAAEGRAERAPSPPPARSALPSQEELDRQAEEYERGQRAIRVRRDELRKAKVPKRRPKLNALDDQVLNMWSGGCTTFDIVNELRIKESRVGYSLVKGRAVGDPRAKRRLSAERCAQISIAQRGRPRCGRRRAA